MKQVDEFGIIELIRRTLAHDPKNVNLLLGIGDDAAVFRTSDQSWNVATVDALTEGIHFDLRYTDFRKLGWKSLAVNLSDIAAMGAVPKWVLINLTIPGRIKTADISELYRGISACSRKFRTQVIGGNITRARNEFVVCITLLGEVEKKHLLKRNAAKVGDVIAVTGDLGGSHAALKILKTGKRYNGYKHIIQKHLSPAPRVEWIGKLLDSGVKIHACIDISDGLSSDLGHVCRSSKVGAELELNKIPIHSETKKAAVVFGEDVIQYGLNGGEEYELLMTLSDENFRKAKLILGKHITAIGKVTASRNITGHTKDKKIKIEPKGFKHF